MQLNVQKKIKLLRFRVFCHITYIRDLIHFCLEQKDYHVGGVTIQELIDHTASIRSDKAILAMILYERIRFIYVPRPKEKLNPMLT